MTNMPEPSGHFTPESRAASEDWWWRLENAAGDEVAVDGVEPRFPSQSDAESWVGETWQELLEQGVDAVTLFEVERKVYGPMSLHSAG